jgi:hypothetical protein
VSTQGDAIRALDGRQTSWDAHVFYASEKQAESEKIRSRERVMDFLAAHADPSRPLQRHRCMTLPGAEWRFESAFEARMGRAPHWVGLERDAGVVEYGVRHMPSPHAIAKSGRSRWRFDLETPEGVISGYHAPYVADLVHSDLRSLIRARHSLCNAGGEWKGPWRTARERLFDWTMMWVDSFSPLTALVEDLARVDRCFHAEVRAAPFAVTMFIGHDFGPVASLIELAPGDAAEKRAAVLGEFLNRGKFSSCVVDDVHRYGTVAVVMGQLVRRRDLSAEERVA